MKFRYGCALPLLMLLGAGCGGGSGSGGGSGGGGGTLPESCTDEIRNQDESDVDCGGTCGPCGNGQQCGSGTDCTSGGCNGDGLCAPVHSIGGTVRGVDGSGMVLQNDGGDDLPVTEDGTFTFATGVPEGDSFDVTVLTGPGTPALYCTVAYGSGVVSTAVTDVEVDCETTPDDIADAFDLTEGVEIRFNTVDATVEATEIYCDGEGTVWYRFTAPADGDYTAYGSGSDHDTEVAWSEGLTGPLGDCNDDASDSYDAVDALLTMTADEEQYVQVGVNSTGYTGTGSVGVVRVDPAADDFADASELSLRAGAATAVAGIAFAGTETSETGEATACGGAALVAPSAWLTFVAPATGTWMIESKSSSTTDIAVYEGAAVDDLTLLNCALGDRVAVLVDLTEGDTYRIRVATSSTDHVVVRAERTGSPLNAAQVDADGDGQHSALAVVDGQPAIAYYEATAAELRFAQRSGGTWSDVLIDADGEGASTDVGKWVSLAVLESGEPAVAYYDTTLQELRYAERSGATWTDVLVDADGDGTSANVGLYAHLVVLESGNPAIVYYDAGNDEVRYAERDSGTWADMLVDADGDGASTNVGLYPSLVELADGLGVAYVDATAAELRFARYDGDAWTDETVYADELGDELWAAKVVLDSAGNPVVAATDTDRANHVIAWWNGSSWDVEWDFADRHLAELDFACAPPNLLIDGDDGLHLVWTDCNYSGTMAISERDADGTWTVRDVAAQHLEPSDPAFNGSIAVWSTAWFGATWLPDGKLAVSFVDDNTDTLWYAEGL